VPILSPGSLTFGACFLVLLRSAHLSHDLGRRFLKDYLPQCHFPPAILHPELEKDPQYDFLKSFHSILLNQ
jgi:hypothetical protein